MITGLYKGFSTFEWEKSGTFSVRDIEAVKLNILNHIFTKKGERLAMPTYGTLIPNLIFEPIDDLTLSVLEEELKYVVNFDPRVELIDMTITAVPDENRVMVSMILNYIELKMVNNMDLNIIFEGTV